MTDETEDDSTDVKHFDFITSVMKENEIFLLRNAEETYEEGYSFVESMGFVLTETDYHLSSVKKKQSYWTALPICQPPKKQEPDTPVSTEIPVQESDAPVSAEIPVQEIEKLRSRSLKSLGSFFASM